VRVPARRDARERALTHAGGASERVQRLRLELPAEPALGAGL